jgi:hypothetical protein
VGAAFEKEIMARNARNKKFGFLQPESPYHPYYQQRLKYGEMVPEGVADLPDAPIDTKGTNPPNITNPNYPPNLINPTYPDYHPRCH